MCGRFQLSNETEPDVEEINRILAEVQANLDKSKTDMRIKTGEIFPTDNAPVLLRDRAGHAAALMRWGFPNWSGSGVIINARSETAHEKPTFAKPVRTSRCVVPSTGFFEWRRENGKTKEKFLFRRSGSGALYMAGIYNRFKGGGGEFYDAFTIMTTAANDSVRDVHGRMPVILYRDEIDGYLADDREAARIFVRDDAALEKMAV